MAKPRTPREFYEALPCALDGCENTFKFGEGFPEKPKMDHWRAMNGPVFCSEEHREKWIEDKYGSFE